MTHAALETHEPMEVDPGSESSIAVVSAHPWAPAAPAGVSGAVVLGLLFLLWFGLEQRDKGTVGEASVSLRQAPDFTLGLFDGGALRLSDELHQGQGRPALVNFWASWCVPCAEEAPVLEDGWQRYRDRVSFVGVDVQDVDADALAFIQKFNVTYPNGAGNAGPTSVAYGMRGVPESYFVARDGRIVRKWNGALSTAALERYLNEVQRAGDT
jgi:cytochrome c biogenesis protein CcmG, thiol:disulfide interchange protein DsbE